MAGPTLIDSYTFRADLIKESSMGSTKLGKYTSTMELYKINDAKYVIDWDIPALDTCEEMAIHVQLNDEGKPEVVDYEGVFSLPLQAVEMLRKHGIIVTEDFE